MANQENFNNLYNVKFKLEINRLPDVTFWVQSCTLPSMSLERSQLPSIHRDIPIPGHKPDFDSFIFNFIVDDSLTNYEAIYNWFTEISSADTVSEMVTTASLHFLDGNNKVKRTIDIVSAYPTLVTELSLNSDDTDLVPVTCSLTLEYAYFKFSDKGLPVWAIG
jgi:hypothetical protein